MRLVRHDNLNRAHRSFTFSDAYVFLFTFYVVIIIFCDLLNIAAAKTDSM